MREYPIIVDTDPGIDDAVAFVVLHHYCPERVALILSSYGNVPLDRATNNALTMRQLLDWNVPVVRGTREDRGRYEDAAHIHGPDGLGGLGKDYPSEDAIGGDFLAVVYEAICAAGAVDYLTLGPLTNLARLLRRYPDVKNRIQRVVTMGGGIGMGNVTPYAEFNIHCDAESAEYVFREANELVLAPLNITTNVAFRPEQIAQVTKADTPLCRLMYEILTVNYNACVKFGEPGSTMHDSTAALCLLFPELFGWERCGVNVDCTPGRYGETLLTGDRDNILLAVSGDPEILLAKIAGCVLGE